MVALSGVFLDASKAINSEGNVIDRVTLIEKAIDDNIALINTPVTATGKPF